MTSILSKGQLTHLIKEQIASVINQEIDSIDEEMDFIKFGVSSLQTIMIINKIKKKLNIDINPIAMFEYKSINQLVNYLETRMNDEYLAV